MLRNLQEISDKKIDNAKIDMFKTFYLRINWLVCVVGLLLCLGSGQAFAAWYQAEGQAVVRNGDVETARREATNDAVRQALLFSGASVHSTQTLVNGLLSNEAFHVDAAGEVKRIEKVRENRRKNILSVTVRANIFARQSVCESSHNFHTLATTYFNVANPEQLLNGGMQNLNVALSKELVRLITLGQSPLSVETQLTHTVLWQSSQSIQQALAIGRRHNVQLALFGSIEDVSVEEAPRSWFGRNGDRTRTFGLHVKLVDTINGAELYENYYTTRATWDFGHHQTVDAFSKEFWSSDYGAAIQDVLFELIDELEDATNCQPATGRILSVVNNQISINLGKLQGLKTGDTVSLYQKNELIDERGGKYIQYNLHPDILRVVSVSVDNAIVESESGGLLGNIQPNDFVTLR